jgi:hypothetical protein
VGTVRDMTVRGVNRRPDGNARGHVHAPARNPYNRLNATVLALLVAPSIIQMSAPARKPHDIITVWDAG